MLLFKGTLSFVFWFWSAGTVMCDGLDVLVTTAMGAVVAWVVVVVVGVLVVVVLGGMEGR